MSKSHHYALLQVLSEVCDLVLIKYNANHNLITNGASNMVKAY